MVVCARRRKQGPRPAGEAALRGGVSTVAGVFALSVALFFALPAVAHAQAGAGSCVGQSGASVRVGAARDRCPDRSAGTAEPAIGWTLPLSTRVEVAHVYDATHGADAGRSAGVNPVTAPGLARATPRAAPTTAGFVRAMTSSGDDGTVKRSRAAITSAVAANSWRWQPGMHPVTVPVLANDRPAAGGRPIDTTTVMIRSPGVSADGRTLLAAGEGVWNVDRAIGDITFTPDADFIGNPTVVLYDMADLAGNRSNITTVTITYRFTILAGDDADTTLPGQPVTTAVLDNDDISGAAVPPGAVVMTVAADPAHGAVRMDGGGAITYTPTAGYVGEDAYDYQICLVADPALCAVATVTITIASASAAAIAAIPTLSQWVLVLLSLLMLLSLWLARRAIGGPQGESRTRFPWW